MHEPNTRSPFIVAVAALVGIASCVIVWIALLTKSLICHGDTGTTCHDGLMSAQLLVALAGLIPAGALLWASLNGKNRTALFFFIAVALSYLLWGLLNDAAVHGWGNLKVF